MKAMKREHAGKRLESRSQSLVYSTHGYGPGAICGIYSCGPDMMIFMSGPSLGPCGIRFFGRLRYHNLDNE